MVLGRIILCTIMSLEIQSKVIIYKNCSLEYKYKQITGNYFRDNKNIEDLILFLKKNM